MEQKALCGKGPGDFKIRNKPGRLEAKGMERVEIYVASEVNGERRGEWILLCVIGSSWMLAGRSHGLEIIPEFPE